MTFMNTALKFGCLGMLGIGTFVGGGLLAMALSAPDVGSVSVVAAPIAPAVVITVPTVAPTATSVPKPKTTATPGITAEIYAEKEYIEEVFVLLDDYSEAFSIYGDSIGKAGADMNLIHDPQWTSTLSYAIATIRVANNEIRAMTPPSRLANVHAELVRASHHFDSGMDYISESFDERSVTKLGIGSDELEAGHRALIRATTEIDTIYSKLNEQFEN
jgi:hypothetical protein